MTSFTRGCGHEVHPTIYTRVFYYYDWIQSIIDPQITTVRPPISRQVFACDSQSYQCGCSVTNVSISMENDGIQASTKIDIVDPQSWSMIVSIVRSGLSSKCTGTIISDHFILTAAHCVTQIDDLNSVVVLTRADHIWSVSGIWIHPNYSSEIPDLHDLAILRLNVSLDLKASASLRMACIHSLNDTISNHLKNSSWFISVHWRSPFLNNVSTNHSIQQLVMKPIDITDISCPARIEHQRYRFCAGSSAQQLGIYVDSLQRTKNLQYSF